MSGISVVIPYYGAPEEVMLRHYEAILANTMKPVEVIVVNDGHESTPPTLPAGCGVSFVYAKILEDIPWNYQMANLGIWLAKGEFISIEDCDIRPEPGYYEAAIWAMGEGYDKYIAHYTNAVEHPAACAVYSRDMLTDLGGFDEDFAGYYGYVDIWMNARIDHRKCKVLTAKEQLLSVNMDGETKNVMRDNTRNRALLEEKLNSRPLMGSILRYPYSVKRFA